MKMLRTLRKNKGLSMKELGEIIGVAESTISQYETGKRQPDFETLLKFGEYFDVSVDYLLRGDTKYSRPHNVVPEKKHPLMEIYDKLNSDGQERLMDYAEDISNIPKYKKSAPLSDEKIG